MNIRVIAVIAACSGLFSTSAYADTDLCNKILPYDLAVGDYSLTIGPGSMSAMGMTMPYAKTHVLPAKVWQQGEDLHLESGHDMKLVFDGLEFNNPDWDFSKDGDLRSKIDEAGLAAAVDCDSIDNMPRLFANGVGSYFTDNGLEVPIQMGLFVYQVRENGVDAMGGMRATAVTSEGTVVFNLQVELSPK